MKGLKQSYQTIRPWLSKAWVQWALACLIFLMISILYMSRGIYDCSSATAALGSDSTGGFGWLQWAGGNDFTWGHTSLSNYPFGENLNKPQFVTSAALIFLYKSLSVVTTPICGLNLLILLGYMSCGLLMFGLVRWLFRRFDIAMFAGYAAAFVPYHHIKSQSHINYMYGSIFIGIIWSYLWLMQRPSYKRALVFAGASSLAFYFDGYFVLISTVLILSLVCSTYGIDIIRAVINRHTKDHQVLKKQLLDRTKYLALSALTMFIILLPILVTYKNNSSAITQSLAAVRSNVKTETLLYGLRPIEFVLPSFDNPLMPDTYPAWRATKLHGSNFSESTLYVGYTILLLAAVSVGGLFIKNKKREKHAYAIPDKYLVIAILFTALGCFLMSLPYRATVFGVSFWTPVAVLTKITANWRVLARFFLAIDPLLIVLAAAGLQLLTKNRRFVTRLAIFLVCTIALSLEYLPTSFSSAQDIYKDAPPVYKKIATDPNIKIVAEYPLADFKFSPVMFTFQPIHKKVLVDANDGAISRGPFDSAIAGLNDPQTLGTLKKLGVDLIITHGFDMNTDTLIPYYSKPVTKQDGSENKEASLFSYTISDTVPPRGEILTIHTGYSDLSVDNQQITHRIIIKRATMQVTNIGKNSLPKNSIISFKANSVCDVPAHVSVSQSGKQLWSGVISKTPVPISISMNNQPFSVDTSYCSIDITYLNAQPAVN